MSDLRIGIVGLGGICRQRHMPGFKAIPGVNVVAVCNRTMESAQAAAAEFGIPDTHASWQELVQRNDLDAILVGTWPYMHEPVSVMTLDAGKHVFCQARMAMNLADAQKMFRAAEQSGRVAALCPVPFGLSVDKTVHRLLHGGHLGEIRLVRVQSFSNAFADPETKMNWRKDHRLSGLNMHTLGMYIEVVHRWFGWTREVSAQSHTFNPSRKDETGDEVEVQIPDQILITSTLEDGTPVQYTINAAVHHGDDRIEIYGARASLRYDVAEDRLYCAKPRESFAPVEVQPSERYDVANWRVEQDFVDAIHEGKPYHPDFHDGLKYMEIIEAVYESSRTGRVVELTSAPPSVE